MDQQPPPTTSKNHLFWDDVYEYFLTDPATMAQAMAKNLLDQDGYRTGLFVVARGFEEVRGSISYFAEWNDEAKAALASYQEPDPDPNMVGWIAVGVENVARFERFLGFGARVVEEAVFLPSLRYACLIRIPRTDVKWQSERLASGMIGTGRWCEGKKEATAWYETILTEYLPAKGDVVQRRPDPPMLIGRRYG